jgi:hypothetical protein
LTNNCLLCLWNFMIVLHSRKHNDFAIL